MESLATSSDKGKMLNLVLPTRFRRPALAYPPWTKAESPDILSPKQEFIKIFREENTQRNLSYFNDPRQRRFCKIRNALVEYWIISLNLVLRCHMQHIPGIMHYISHMNFHVSAMGHRRNFTTVTALKITWQRPVFYQRVGMMSSNEKKLHM